MTKKLYYEDSYLSCFKAKVLNCEKVKKGYRILLDQTAFYPEGGGQPADEGYLGEAKVQDVMIEEDLIYHLTDKPLSVGEVVKGEINFERRFDLMQQHSGEHIVSGLINKLYGYNNVGFHLGLDNMTADVDGQLSEEQLLEIERLANEAVYQDIEVMASIYPNEQVQGMNYRSKLDLKEDVRLVKIEGYDTCACCGTHVRKTGEIGIIKCISSERHRGGMRLTLVCGKRAQKDYHKKQEIVTKAMALLSAKPEKVIEHIQKLQEELMQTKWKLTLANNKCFEMIANQYKKNEDSFICIKEEGLSADEIRRMVTILMEQTHKLCLVLVTEGNSFKYALGHMSMDVRPLCKALNKAFSGKGGGKEELCQGSIQGDFESIKAFLLEQLSLVE